MDFHSNAKEKTKKILLSKIKKALLKLEFNKLKYYLIEYLNLENNIY